MRCGKTALKRIYVYDRPLHRTPEPKVKTLRGWWENRENFIYRRGHSCSSLRNREILKIQEYRNLWIQNTETMKKYVGEIHQKAIQLCSKAK